MLLKTIYDVVIVTNRNYGLYCGFANGILGLKTLILEYNYIPTKKTPYIKEDKIWFHETRENYLVSVNKLNISVINIENFFYHYNNISKTFFIQQDLNPNNKIETKYMIYALNSNHPHIPIYDNENYLLPSNNHENIYIVGEKITYKNKIFKNDFYTGECNFVAQIIYQKIHNKIENITVHSTDLS